MRFVQPAVLLLGIGVYAAVIAIFLGDGGMSDDPWFVGIAIAWNLALLVATIIAIADSVRRLRAKRTRQLAFDAMVVKLASIPFFLVNFAMFLFASVASLVLIMIGPIIWTVIAIGIGLTYLTMLSTSVYAWATIAQLRRERVIGTGLAILYTILTCLFVTDVVAAVLLFGHSRRRPRLALAWLLTATGAAMIVGGVLDFFLGFLKGLVPELGYSAIGWLEWMIPIAVGVAVILATGIVSFVRRASLRLEAQAAAALDASTESVSETL
ncbi:MAG: hypothetical protein ABIO06_07410 [Pseudolysinimonas sp.]